MVLLCVIWVTHRISIPLVLQARTAVSLYHRLWRSTDETRLYISCHHLRSVWNCTRKFIVGFTTWRVLSIFNRSSFACWIKTAHSTVPCQGYSPQRDRFKRNGAICSMKVSANHVQHRPSWCRLKLKENSHNINYNTNLYFWQLVAYC